VQNVAINFHYLAEMKSLNIHLDYPILPQDI